MVVRYNDILTVITTLGDDECLKVTVKGSAKGGLIAGVTSALGGLILGPLGLAVGGTLGGLLAYAASEPYKPVSQVIMYEMRPVDQEKLVGAVRNLVEGFDIQDAIELVALVQGNPVLKAKVIAEMTTFFKHQLDMQLDYHQ